MNLNEEQKLCVAAHQGVHVVAASPGSGKTTVLIQRYFSMLESGINDKDMLTLTFTNSAAKEMSERAGVLKGGDSVFKTFHSFAMDMLKKEREHLSFNLCPTVIPVAGEDYQLLFDLVKTYPAIKNFRELKEKISDWKKRGVSPEEAIDKAIGVEYFSARAFLDYETECRKAGWVDFDSAMQEAVLLLETNEDVRNRWKRKYIAIDELQDTDACQFDLLKLLFDGNIFAVGDTNQNLYTWRGSQSDNLNYFGKTFIGAELKFLGENFRSTKRLVEFFKKILPEDNGISSHMMTNNEDGVDPVITRYQDDYEEAEQVLASVIDPENTAILARTNRQLFIFQRICTIRKIKYKILGKKDFWEQNEIKRLMSLAKESSDPRPANQVLTSIIERYNLLNIYKDSNKPTESSPVENLNNVVKMSANKGNIHEFLDYLRRLTKARKSAKGLMLSTLHQAKGMQWKHVYLVGCHQGTMPHLNGEFAEEKRCWFVGCTRAAKTLNISFFKKPSEFFQDFEHRINVYTPNFSEEN